MKWIIPCNVKYYDVVGAFHKLKKIDWKQTAKNIEVNDIVYIYVAKPLMAILYKCIVTKTNLYAVEIDDTEFVVNGEVFSTYPRHMELTLIECYNDNEYTLSKLRKYGLTARMQGPIRVDEKLEKLLEN